MNQTGIRVLIAIGLAVGAARAQNLLTNGSFESPVVPDGSFQNFNSGSTGIPGWTVTGPAGKGVSVVSGDYTNGSFSFPAEDGSQWLDLTGDASNDAEGVSQSVSTVAGQTYTLSFWVGNLSGGIWGIASSVGLSINGTPVENFTNSTPGSTQTWQQFFYSFIATSDTTTIEFDNLDPTNDNTNGLDNVDLEEGGTAAPAPTNLITNGDFETPVIPTGTYTNVNSGSTAIPGWTVVGSAPNTVALVTGAYIAGGIYFPAENGHQWMDLTGTGVSSASRGISQIVPTTSGTAYSLSFWVGNVYNPGGIYGTTSTVGLQINGNSAGTFTNSATTTIQSWQQFQTTFTASGSSTTIEFDNLDPSDDTSNGLDNVVLQEAGSSVVSIAAAVSAADFGGFPMVAPGSWIEIYGSGLASDTRGWAGSDFNGNNAPTSLDGTSVSIEGQAAFVDFISPGQVNVQIPSNVDAGVQQITVTNGNNTSLPISVLVNPGQPGLLAPAAFNVNGVQYAVAILDDGSYAMPAGAISGVATRPASPGETIILYGVGFGPVTPDTPAGQIVQQSNSLASDFEISIGGMAAMAAYFGLAPSFVGLYQFNITVPDVASGDAVPLEFTLGGIAGIQPLNIAVGN